MCTEVIYFSNKPIEYSMLNGSAGIAANQNNYTLSTQQIEPNIKQFRYENIHPNFDIHCPFFDYEYIKQLQIDENISDLEYFNRCYCIRMAIMNFEKYDPTTNLNDFLLETPTYEYVLFCKDNTEIAKFIIKLFNILLEKLEIYQAIANLHNILIQLCELYTSEEYSDGITKLQLSRAFKLLNPNPLITFIYSIVVERTHESVYFYDNVDYNPKDLYCYIDDFIEMLYHFENSIYRLCLADIFNKICDFNNTSNKCNIMCSIDELSNFLKYNSEDAPLNTERIVSEIIDIQYNFFKALELKYKCMYAQYLCMDSTDNSYIIRKIRSTYNSYDFAILVSSRVNCNIKMFDDEMDLYKICSSIDKNTKDEIRKYHYSDNFQRNCSWDKFIKHRFGNYKQKSINFH